MCRWVLPGVRSGLSLVEDVFVCLTHVEAQASWVKGGGGPGLTTAAPLPLRRPLPCRRRPASHAASHRTVKIVLSTASDVATVPQGQGMRDYRGLPIRRARQVQAFRPWCRLQGTTASCMQGHDSHATEWIGVRWVVWGGGGGLSDESDKVGRL